MPHEKVFHDQYDREGIPGDASAIFIRWGEDAPDSSVVLQTFQWPQNQRDESADCITLELNEEDCVSLIKHLNKARKKTWPKAIRWNGTNEEALADFIKPYFKELKQKFGTKAYLSSMGDKFPGPLRLVVEPTTGLSHYCQIEVGQWLVKKARGGFTVVSNDNFLAS